MVSFLKKRLQVFVSSTYVDLREERQAAVEAILRAGHIPAGMELFSSGDESQMEVIKQWIDESDVYLLILGGRYGSIEPNSGKSYTHIEYEYAVQQNKPLFACVLNHNAIDERVKKHGILFIEQENPRKLKEFESLVSSKMIRFWSDIKDIKLIILGTLPDFSRRETLMGWIRAGGQVDAPALADEIARLSRENSELREKISQFGNIIPELIAGISYFEMKDNLQKKMVKINRINLETGKAEGINEINLLEYLLERRYILAKGYSPEDFEEVACAELVSRGLLESYRNPTPSSSNLGFVHFGWRPIGYRMTLECCILLNKFDVEFSEYQISTDLTAKLLED